MLETAGTVEFVGPSGVPLALEPPYAFEQGRFEAGIPGSYRLSATADPNVVELLVRVPWAWLADPGRQFPVVVDPRFILRGPVQWAQVRSTFPLSFPAPSTQPEQVQLIRDRARPAIGYWAAKFTDGNDGKTRLDELAIRFGMPTLPPGAELTNAYFIAAPIGTPRNRRLNQRFWRCDAVKLERVKGLEPSAVYLEESSGPWAEADRD